MKKVIFQVFIIAGLASLSSFNSFEPNRRPFCGFSIKDGYYGYQKKEYITREARLGDQSGIPDVVDKIKKTLGFGDNISIYIAAAEDNCFATISKDGNRMLIADADFLEQVNQHSGTKWGAISVLAHEVGHHISGFDRYSDDHQSELDADYWSGYILNKLGSSENASVKCMLTIGSEQDSDSHPNKYARVASIKVGWENARDGIMDRSKCQGCR